MKLKLNKWKYIILTSIIVAAPVLTAVGVVVTQTNTVQNITSENSFDYVLSNSTKHSEESETNNSRWSITLNSTNEVMYFDSPEQMQTKLGSYIQENFANTSYDLEKYTDPNTGILGGDQQGDDLWKNLNIGVNKDNLKIQTVYRGENGQIFTNAVDAKSSYLQLQEAYYFNDIYFNTKEELRKYLLDEYFYDNTPKANAITIKAPNNTISAPINIPTAPADTNTQEFINFERSVKSFVQSNASKVLKYDRTKNQNGESVPDKTLYFTPENYMDKENEINLNDLDYQFIASNQGKSKYILDLDVSDEHNLYAPYIYEGTLDIGSFSNKDNWQKSKEGDTVNIPYQAGQINHTIGTFFSFLLSEDQTINNTLYDNNIESIKLFNIPEIKFDTNHDGSVSGDIDFDSYYLSEMNKTSKILFSEVLDMYKTMLRGKKYNAFYKIPLMYSFIMQRIVSYNLSQSFLNLTVEYFRSICDYLQDGLETVTLNTKLLTNFYNNKPKFNIGRFFNIGNPQFDISTSIDAYMEIFKKEYPLLVGAIIASITGISDLNSYAGLYSTLSNSMQKLVQYSVVNDENRSLFLQNASLFHDVYKLWTKPDYKTFLNYIIEKNSLNKIINHSMFFNLEKYIATLSYGLHNFLVNANAYLENDINRRNNAGKYSGILSNLYIKNTSNSYPNIYPNSYPNSSINYISRFSEWLPYNSQIIKETVKNTDFTLYQIYMLLIVDYNFCNSSNFSKNFNSWQSMSISLNNLKNYISKIFPTVLISPSSFYSNATNFMFKYFTVSPRDFAEPSIYTYNDPLNENIIEMVTKYVKYVATIIDVGLSSVTAGIPVASMVLGAIEFYVNAFRPQTTKYLYTYTTASNDKFIWDGGSEERVFFNLINTGKDTTNKDMKLLPPIQFVLPQMQDCYYYDGIRYYSPDEIKRVQLQHMMNSLLNDKKLNLKKRFSYIYTFDTPKNDLTTDTINEIKGFDSITKLQDYIFNNIYNSLNGGLKSNYIKSEVIAFSDGFKADNDMSIMTHLTNNVIENIRPTWMALKPLYDINTGYPIKNQANRTFIFPDKSWSSASGLYTNTTINTDQYLIDNSANDLLPGIELSPDGTVSKNEYMISSKYQASDVSKAILTKNFLALNQVESKNVLISEYMNKSNFDNLNDAIYEQRVYKVTLPNLETEYFIDIAKAQRWLSQNLQAKKIGSYITKETYDFYGHTFTSIAEMKQWTLDNMQLINQIRGK